MFLVGSCVVGCLSWLVFGVFSTLGDPKDVQRNQAPWVCLSRFAVDMDEVFHKTWWG